MRDRDLIVLFFALLFSLPRLGSRGLQIVLFSVFFQLGLFEFTTDKTGKGQFLRGNRRNLAGEGAVRKISSPQRVASVSNLCNRRSEGQGTWVTGSVARFWQVSLPVHFREVQHDRVPTESLELHGRKGDPKYPRKSLVGEMLGPRFLSSRQVSFLVSKPVGIGAGSGGWLPPWRYFVLPWTTFAPPSDFCSEPLFSGNAGFWVKKTLQIRWRPFF